MTMTDSLYIRLAGPLQSWAGPRVTGNVVRTEPRPTRSGLEGLLAAALGWPQDQWEEWIHSVTLTVRSDRPGSRIDEYQTINPRDEDLRYQQRAYLLTFGKRWSKRAHFTPDGQNKTSIVNRTYLADAEFLVEIRNSEHFSRLLEAVRQPFFTTYLGRKAFAPSFPFVLGVGEPGLLETLPTSQHGRPPATYRNEYFDAVPGSDGAHLRIDALAPSEGHSWHHTNVAELPRDEWLDHVSRTLDRTGARSSQS